MARKSCKCPMTAMIMTLLGAEHAAEMHKRLDGDFSRSDWKTHMREEKQYVVPLLSLDAAARIERDHVVMERWLDEYGGFVTREMEEFVDAHAEFEEKVVVAELGYLLRQAEGVTTSAAGLRRALLEHRARVRGRTMGRARRVF